MPENLLNTPLALIRAFILLVSFFFWCFTPSFRLSSSPPLSLPSLPPSRCGQGECPAVPQLCPVHQRANAPRLSQPGAEAAQRRQLQEAQHQENRMRDREKRWRQREQRPPWPSSQTSCCTSLFTVFFFGLIFLLSLFMLSRHVNKRSSPLPYFASGAVQERRNTCVGKVTVCAD